MQVLLCLGRKEFQYRKQLFCYLPRQERRNCIANLDILLSSVSFEKVIVGESLKTSHFTYSQTSTLCRIWVDIVVPILGNVASYRLGWSIPELYSITVSEFPVRQFRWFGDSSGGKFSALGDFLLTSANKAAKKYLSRSVTM